MVQEEMEIAAGVHPAATDEGHQRELGEGADDDEIEELRERLRRARLTPEAEKIARKQLLRLVDAAAVGGVQRHQDLPRMAGRFAVGQEARPIASKSPTCGVASTRITTVSRRSSASSNTWRSASCARTRRPHPLLHQAARGRKDVARPIDRALHGATLRPHRAWRRARRSRDPGPSPYLRRRAARPHHPGAQRSGHRRCSSSTRSTSSASICAATLLRLCSKCSTPSRTSLSRTTTSIARSTCRRSRFSPPPTTTTPFLPRCSTAWRSST